MFKIFTNESWNYFIAKLNSKIKDLKVSEETINKYKTLGLK